MVLIRHGWAWIRESCFDNERGAPNPADQQLIERWRDAGLPFVVAAAHGTTVIRLGLATPDKRRVGFSVPSRCIARTAPRLLLADAIVAAPIAWRKSLRAIVEESMRCGVHVHVYGSLAWTYQSKIRFFRPDSDVDLLLVPYRASLANIHLFTQALAAHRGAPRLDGELLAPTGAVSWREFAQRSETLLVKRDTGPVIQARVEFEVAITEDMK